MNKKAEQKSRREFIKKTGFITGTALVSSLPGFALSNSATHVPQRLSEQIGQTEIPQWISHFATLKDEIIHQRQQAPGITGRKIRKKFGEKATSITIDLKGIDTLYLSARRGNQEDQWDYAVWGNACFINAKGKRIWLDEIPFEYERTGHDSSPQMRKNDKGNPIRIARKTYEHGIFCFADSILAYPIKKGYKTFEAEIGIEDNASPKGSVYFSVSNKDMYLLTKDFYRQYPKQVGALYSASMKVGVNMENLLLTPDASTERAIVQELLSKLKGDITLYRQALERADKRTDLKEQIISYLTLFEQLRKAHKSQLAENAKFSFAFLTDVHLYENNSRGSNDGFSRALEQVKQQEIDFILFGGDNAPIDHYKAGDERAEKFMNEFKTMVEKNGQKAYYTAGNHDLVFTNGSLDQQSVRLYEKVFGPAYYSFAHKGVRFIILNSNEQDGNGVFRIGEQQFEWLKKELRTIETDTPIVLSMHVPMLSLYYPVIEGKYVINDGMFSNYKEVWDMLRDHHIILVLQGHQHIYEEIYTRKIQFITGGAICDNWWLDGGFGDTFGGYLMVYVDPDNRFSWEYEYF